VIYYQKQIQNKDFVLGNRKLNYYIAAISANASDMSIWIFMGLPVNIYKGGLINFWIVIGLVVFMFLNWHFIALKLRNDTAKYDAITLFSYFEYKLDDKHGMIRIISAFWSLFFLLIYIAVGIIGIGYFFKLMFNINYNVGCSLGVVVIVIYSYIGGFNLISIIDFYQGMFLCVVVCLVPILGLIKIGNIHVINNILFNVNVFYSFMSNLNNDMIIKIFNLSIGWGLGYFGQPHILNKFMAIKNDHDIKKAKIISTVWQILTLSFSALVGVVAIVILENVDNVQLIFVYMVNELVSPFFAGIILCAILSATLSTVDSQILVLSSIISEDIYKNIINHNASHKQVLQVSKYSVILIAIISLLIALYTRTSIFELVHYCWIGLGCAFGPLIIMCLYYKHINKYGALSGILVGGILGSIWLYFEFSISASFLGFGFGLLSIFFVSKLSYKFI